MDLAMGGARIDAREHPTLVGCKLTDITVQITAREGHPVVAQVARGGPDVRRCVLDRPWISYTEMKVCSDDADCAISNSLGREPNVWMKSSTLLTVLSTLQRTDSLCVLSDQLVRHVAGPRLMPVSIDLRRRRIPLEIILREELADWAVLWDFIDL